MPGEMRIPTAKDVIAAMDRLRSRVRRTPVLESAWLNERIGGRVLLKPECLQLAGSFKIRGAFNRLLQLCAEERARGIVAWSAGNHAQALAFASAQLGVRTTIVMPADAPRAKIEGTRRYGATVLFYDRKTEDREAIGRALAASSGAIIIPPYEDADVIAGQGTAGLELLEDSAARGTPLDRMMVCVGGGGLIAGCALAARARGEASVEFFAAEPVGYDDTLRSLQAGVRVKNDMHAPCTADALMTVTPGELTFSLNRELLKGGFTVSDADIRDAMRFAFTELRLVIEPGGAAALAAVLSRPKDFADRTTGVLLTGGNVDAQQFCAIVGGEAQGEAHTQTISP
jgi:threonine dehydratase